MEQFGLTKEMPKFSSPQEELDYLRAHVAEREKILAAEQNPKTREAIAEELIEDYREAPVRTVLEQKHALPEKQVEQLVLSLRPETHDARMEELLGILLDKGIKNAMQVAEGLGDPHVDDDFHRFLVQYLKATHGVPGLKEETPLWKALDMRLFEVSLPEMQKGEEGAADAYKKFIEAMEQFYAGMQSVGGQGNITRNYYTLEISLSSTSREVLFFAGIPTKAADLFEKQILGFYQDAKIREVTDDYNVFAEGGTSVGSFARLAELEIYPLKTYEEISHDPMNAIINAFSKLKEVGEGAAVQFVIVPGGDRHVKRFSMALSDIKKGAKPKEAVARVGSIGSQAGQVFKDLVFGDTKVKKEEKHVDDKAVELVGNKVKSTIMDAAIRIIASGPTKERADSILKEVESSFHQFTLAGSNHIAFEYVSQKDLREFFHEFSYRLYDEREALALNLKELASLFHFPVGVSANPQLKQAQAAIAPAPASLSPDGIILGYNDYRGQKTEVRMAREDRVRHMYVIGQTGTGKTVFLKNMIIQDIKNGDGVCFIDPHGSDIQDILANIPPERIDDVIYFDPAHMARPMGLNMLEYDPRFPEQKTFVVNELLAIFNKLFDMKTAGGPAFEQYFRNSALLVMEHPESGSTLLEIGRVLADKQFRDLKLSHCKNPIIKQFWDNAEKTSGEQSLANFVPYVTNKFDVFVSNDIMRPIIAQQESVFNFREVMDNKKILLVNLSKGRLGDINANLIGLILVGKITMAALSRVDIVGKGVPINDFYLYIDEFQNITTDSIEVILSEARKYRLSLNVAHQYIEQLEEGIKDAVFGNVGTMVVHRVSPENAEVFAKTFEPVFKPTDIIKLENLNCYVKMLVNGVPAKPFNSFTPFPPKGNPEMTEKVKELSYLKFGRPREEVEEEIMARYKQQF